MRVLVCGATGCVGSAVARALRSRGHQVIAGARGEREGSGAMALDFSQAVTPADWAARLRACRVEALVNCVGMLMPGPGQSFERVHALGPIELFRGAAEAGVRRVVQVSALGVGGEGFAPAAVQAPRAAAPGSEHGSHDADRRAKAARDRGTTPYLSSKGRADAALAALPLEWAVVRPSLVYGPHSQSAQLFATLASLPLISLPGRGAQPVAPVHVFELAEAIVRLLEQAPAPNAVFELGGPRPMAYRDMLATYRDALGLGAALWLPLPMALMSVGARLAEALPQQVFSRDTLGLLEQGSVPERNALPRLLGRAPSTLAHGLAISPPEPLLDLRVALSPAVALALRSGLAFMWLYTAAVSALLPGPSGVLALLARCGFEGPAGVAALVFSCALNSTLGVLTLLRPTPWVYAIQAAAVCGYSVTAALSMPALTIDHCGPLAKNVPVLLTVLLLWLAAPARRGAAALRPGRQPAGAPALTAHC